MSDYTKQLEEQNEQLQTRLAEAEAKIAKRNRKEKMTSVGRGFKMLASLLNVSHIFVVIFLALFVLTFIFLLSVETEKINIEKEYNKKVDDITNVYTMQRDASSKTIERLVKENKQLKQSKQLVEAK